MSSQYGELWPTRGWERFVSLGHSGKFQRVLRFGFVTAATSLNGSQPNFAQCLAIPWTGTLYIHLEGFLPRNRILPGATFILRPSLELFYFGSVTACHALHSSSEHQPNFAALNRGRHLYSARRPSCWALAHILVKSILHWIVLFLIFESCIFIRASKSKHRGNSAPSLRSLVQYYLSFALVC